MRVKHMAAFSVLAVACFGLIASAQQKPATAPRTSSTPSVVVYKSPT